MTPFEILVLGHFITDWLFQTKRQAYGKLTDWVIRLEHCAIYSLLMSWIFWLFIKWDMTFLQDILLGFYFLFTHFIFDTPKVKLWWCRVIKREDNPPEWLLK
jgi:hypothetical protein